MEQQSKKKIKGYMIFLDVEIGQGAVGKVYLCYHQSAPKTPLAVKIIDKKKLDHNQYLKLAIKRQLKVHKKLNHVNIVELIDYQETKNNLYIFQEYCEGRNLKTVLTEHGRFQEGQVMIYAKQIISGFSQLVRKGVIHRDLKPQNIIQTINNLKICDFGYSKHANTQNQLMQSLVGSPIYMAPQILQGQKYSAKCDVWSFGIILYELLYNKFPWGHHQKTTAGLLTQILTSPLTFPSHIQVSSTMKQFIQNCLKMDEKLRLGWIEIFEHQLFQDQFKCIALEFHRNMKIASVLLDDLVGRATVVQLVGTFLSFKVKALDFVQFSSIIKWKQFVPEATQPQLSFMYEMFDKDCNGVIDIYQFVRCFQVCDDDILKLLNQLIEEGMMYENLKDQTIFYEKCSNKQYSNDIINTAWQIIDAITIEEE